MPTRVSIQLLKINLFRFYNFDQFKPITPTFAIGAKRYNRLTSFGAGARYASHPTPTRLNNETNQPVTKLAPRKITLNGKSTDLNFTIE